ncbi:hypothetical protein G7084_03095 [Weissella coleopterorum]|uniref:Uncharacterized protein n=1 Tax=Weissella coleopterorum TaxID=2714949 RepID=A0A6G8AZI1_9LACO|nr:hypothetical protein [Weissella coleopterorum]QIL50390.1 hypothetical protein G7084_03095 [Weissella coleopterorum]
MLENQSIKLDVASDGHIKNLMFKDDPNQMNWVIDDQYLKQEGYSDANKLFGNFKITINQEPYRSDEQVPVISEGDEKISILYQLTATINLKMQYQLDERGQIIWDIELQNLSDQKINIDYFGVWISFAYVMFRDKNVLRNIHNSAAVFPSISKNYTKINVVRRDNQGGNVGFYQTVGETKSVGTYCDYKNKFFENISPSLDGLLFHQLILAGGYERQVNEYDWVYNRDGLTLESGKSQYWRYVMNRNQNEVDFKEQAKRVQHPMIEYDPLNIIGHDLHIKIDANQKKIEQVQSFSGSAGQHNQNLLKKLKHKNGDNYELVFSALDLGEHKVEFTFTDGTSDFVVINVMEPLDQLIEKRVDYLSKNSYLGPNGATPYAFTPISNQGESLGKLNLILKKNILGQLDAKQVRQVEASAVYYVKNKWFKNGNLNQPARLYGDFYRCMDFEYIGHLFFLLSEFDDDILTINSASEYLKWSATVFELRVNPDLHATKRGKEEAQMLGVYFLYIDALLQKLKEKGLQKEYQKINELWNAVTKRIAAQSDDYSAAITEHYFDNAGFGPTAGAMSSAHQTKSAENYGALLLANIGYSNDFRAQNPDRWWEALSYMIHSLWGGITSASAYKVFEGNHKEEYLRASYRALAGVLYCYDTNATATTPLATGLAASTYSVAGPHLNRPDLSRARFGQATFYQDGGIFARLFRGDEKTDDWDMGEELVAYLDGLGQKTFVLMKDNQLQVINGTYSQDSNQVTIYSFAPYQAEVYLLTGQGLQRLGETDENHEYSINLDVFE